ncbi:MAG TPA: GNAT family N-acetyltransferase [Bryobacteraceae bacterium]|jgi:GNAT superfamily N-acetyltransferase|nr:GNAT family N-acetyltransferase [Bryobacteraceae bacterium]
MQEVAISIREMVASDAADAAELCAQLGYPVTPHEIKERLRQFADFRDHVVFVACLDNRVVGWIDVGIVQHLQGSAYGEIGGLIVADEHRGCGIGQQLLRRAEEWTASFNVEKMLVRSRTEREGAHVFYNRNGFSHVKTSAVFTKPLSSGA